MSDAATTKKCPYCAETIQAEAIKCRFCGSDLNSPVVPFPQNLQTPQPIAPAPAPKSTKQGKTTRWLGIGIASVLGICLACSILIAGVNALGGDTPSASETRSTPRPTSTGRATAATGATAQPTDPPATMTSIPVQVGTADNPAPLNTALELDGNSVMVTNVRFGVEAEIEAANMFNSAPESGQQYVEVSIISECLNDECIIAPYNFEVVGAKGIVYDVQSFLSGVDGMLESTEYLKGAKIENKKLFFIVDTSDSNLAMRWTAFITLADGYFDLN